MDKNTIYRKVANSSLSRLVAHFWIFRLFMKGKLDITKLHLEGRCMHRPTALGGAICKLHRPNFFFFQNDRVT